MQTGKALQSVTLNADDEESVIMNPFSHPEVSCIDATLFSMNIPFLFHKLIYQGKHHVDGVLANPYPVDFYDNGETNILGIYLKNKQEVESSSKRVILEKIEQPRYDLSAFAGYIARIFEALIEQRRAALIASSFSEM